MGLISTIFAIFLGFWGVSSINVLLKLEKYSRFHILEPSNKTVIEVSVLIAFVVYVAYFIGRLTMAIQAMYRFDVRPGNGRWLDLMGLCVSRLWGVYLSLLIFLAVYNVVVIDQVLVSVSAALLVLSWFIVMTFCWFKSRREEI